MVCLLRSDGCVPKITMPLTHMNIMMTSSNGNIFRVTGPLCGEFTGPGEFPTQRPVTRSFDVFFDLPLNKRLSKQPWGWSFETPSWSLWRHRNDHKNMTQIIHPLVGLSSHFNAFDLKCGSSSRNIISNTLHKHGNVAYIETQMWSNTGVFIKDFIWIIFTSNLPGATIESTALIMLVSEKYRGNVINQINPVGLFFRQRLNNPVPSVGHGCV